MATFWKLDNFKRQAIAAEIRLHIGRESTRKTRIIFWFLIRAHSRNSRLVLFDQRSSAKICGCFLFFADCCC
jgi:hypothetical protein